MSSHDFLFYNRIAAIGILASTVVLKLKTIYAATIFKEHIRNHLNFCFSLTENQRNYAMNLKKLFMKNVKKDFQKWGKQTGCHNKQWKWQSKEESQNQTTNMSEGNLTKCFREVLEETRSNICKEDGNRHGEQGKSFKRSLKSEECSNLKLIC